MAGSYWVDGYWITSEALESATSYITVDFFKEYHDERGNSYSGFSDTLIEQAILRATDYIDNRWGLLFKGVRVLSTQALCFPRNHLYDNEGYLVEGTPTKLKKATAEYALRALSVVLAPDPTVDDSLNRVTLKREKVGPIEEETRFAEGGVPQLVKDYPFADRFLLEYISSQRGVIRA